MLVLLLKCLTCEDVNTNVIYNLQLRLRHRVDTYMIVYVNQKMGAVQRQELERTPFRWMLQLEEPLKICNDLLLELVSRWSVESRSFRIREHLVPFNLFYVCVVLGLAVRGEEVCFDNCTPDLVNNLFGEEDITIQKIVEKLRKEENVHNYCRMYILFVFADFYFPCTSRTVSTFHFSLLDDLESLHLWNWGKVVHSLLVRSLDQASH